MGQVSKGIEYVRLAIDLKWLTICDRDMQVYYTFDLFLCIEILKKLKLEE